MEATERLVNLAMFLESSPRPVTAEECRAEIAGYPEDQDDSAFFRMFERDKDELRAAGVAIRVSRREAVEAYEVDRAATHVRPVDFTPEEEAVLRVATASLAADPSFPFAEDLRLALAKALPEVDAACALPVAGSLADEDPAAQGTLAGVLADAADARKRVVFGYTNARGETAEREVEPYGLFLREGRWYLVALDSGRLEVRTFALTRMREPRVNQRQPKTPDFAVPEEFDISTFVLLPFQYGDGELREAVVRIAPAAAFRADTLTAGVGELASATPSAGADATTEDSLLWRVGYRDGDALLRWLIANGPGLEPLEPSDLVARLVRGLEEVAARHGS